nr:putative RNA-directed DNA polymerase [Tanacetum cinerariifolium]
VKFFLHRFNPSRISHGFFDVFQFGLTHDDHSSNDDQKGVIDRILVQRGLHAQVRIIQTDKGTEFLNKTLHAYFAAEGIQHQTYVARTPEQNGVVKR